jgi:hypothetical protein
MLATVALFCCSALALPADTPRSAVTSSNSIISVDAPLPAEPKDVKPDAPTPKMVSLTTNDETGTGVEPVAPAVSSPFANAPVRPATTESYETPRQRMFWYGLMAAGHAGAGFDAWTTRRAISGGYGIESDPTERPFAHSGAIYATTQVSPLIMDYVGHKMMRSRYPLLRKFWWVPQAANASFSWSSAIHNYRIVP